MGKIHELLAVDTDKANVATKLSEEAIKTFGSKPDHFLGATASTVYLDDTRQRENSSASKEMVTTVDDKLSFLIPKIVDHYDVLYQKELGNQLAKSDLIINGVVVARDLPSMFLLTMENRLKTLRAVFAAIPTLEPSIKWTEDSSLGKGVFRSAEQESTKTEKDTQFRVLYDATKEHPAQIEKWSVDKVVALVKRVQYSGMWTVAQKAAVLDRLDVLVQGIKQARMRANLTEAPNAKVADSFLSFVLSGTLPVK